MTATAQHSSLIPLYRLLIASTLVALLAVLAYFVLPERKERILPDLMTGEYHLFFDGQNEGNTQAEWVDKNRFSFKCIATTGGIDAPYCGLSINIGKAPKGKDYSEYQRMEIKIHYRGDNQRMRLSMHNFNPANPKHSNRETLKGLDVSFLTAETRAPLVIHNYGWKESENWALADSWFERDDPNNLVDIGIDLVPPIVAGEHEIQVEYIDIYGELLPAETWYLGVILFWLIFNLLFISRHLRIQASRIRNDSQRLASLAHYSEDLQQESQHYKLLSNTDQLTGALNRNGFAEEMSMHSPDGKMLRNTTLMVIDLDSFKRINDNLGHDAGDEVLRTTAQVIHKNTRAADRFVRWGGEEFILFCRDTNAQQALLIAEKIRASVEAIKTHYQENTIAVTVSIGIGVAEAQENFDSLFQRTDQALYRAKHMGRNCIVLAEIES